MTHTLLRSCGEASMCNRMRCGALISLASAKVFNVVAPRIAAPIPNALLFAGDNRLGDVAILSHAPTFHLALYLRLGVDSRGYSSSEDSSHVEQMSQVMSKLTQLRSLYLTMQAGPREQIDVLVTHLQRLAPTLESLTFRAYQYGAAAMKLSEVVSLTAPAVAKLFRLRSLDISDLTSDVAAAIAAGPGPSLQQLTLPGAVLESEGASRQLQTRLLSAVLSGCRNLTKLFAFCDASNTQPPCGVPALIPHSLNQDLALLQDLELQDCIFLLARCEAANDNETAASAAPSSSELADALSKMPHLTRLSLVEPYGKGVLTGSHVKAIAAGAGAQLTKLFVKMQLTGSGFVALCNHQHFPALETLVVTGSYRGGIEVPRDAVLSLPQSSLHVLNLSNCTMSRKSFASLWQSSGTGRVGGWKHLYEVTLNVEELSNDNSAVDGEQQQEQQEAPFDFFQPLLQQCPLRVLSMKTLMGNGHNFAPNVTPALGATLTELYLHDFSAADCGATLSAVIRNCPKLQTLKINESYQQLRRRRETGETPSPIDSAMFGEAIAESFPASLEAFCLSAMPVTSADAIVDALVRRQQLQQEQQERCETPQLRQFDIVEPRLSMGNLFKLAENYPMLETVSLVGDDFSLQALAKRFPRRWTVA